MAMKDEFERLLLERGKERYVLRLYVSGMTPRSTEAVETIASICEELLAGRYDLEVVNLYDHPDVARMGQIVAAPTLVKSQPAPERRLVGNLQDRPRVLRALNLPVAGEPIA